MEGLWLMGACIGAGGGKAGAFIPSKIKISLLEY